ncbi:conserved hypothetical protein [Pyrobaculum islandicum DSM 4184]|uniref:Uncharacterized protein n=1 Tax=Pyrobaculum islandicum (strain DSM 4184 / JCM 9189 / GEO3) TaxID=384616 RepID=A1RST5_PYRIL|nr:hypothetical protein [Pyrobaculum islandicum]ABL88017.1 conserved hypothetical protein [Pyrobaculum islandicum DSM 4184]
MERLPLELTTKLRKMAQELEGVGARSIINYVIYEFEVGGQSLEVLEEAEQMAKKEIEELYEVIKVIEELRKAIV